MGVANIPHNNTHKWIRNTLAFLFMFSNFSFHVSQETEKLTNSEYYHTPSF